MPCFRTLFSRACRLGFSALVFFPLCLFHTCIVWFCLVFRPSFLSPLLAFTLALCGFNQCFISYLHRLVFHPRFVSPSHVIHLHCMVLSVFCFITCICIRAVMFTIWSSYEPGLAPFGTLTAQLSI